MSGLSERDVERLAEVLRENRDRDYAASVYKFTPEKMARAVLTSDWLAERDAAIRDEAKAEALRGARQAIRDAKTADPSTYNVWSRVYWAIDALLDAGDQS